MTVAGTEIRDLLDFIDASPTASWAVLNIARLLKKAGFKRLYEKDSWGEFNQGDRFFVIRSASSIIAGIKGTNELANGSIRIIGAHTDFPGFRIKPSPERIKDGTTVLGVEIYGSPILATWFDRDLSVAGSLVVRKDNSLERILFKLEAPLCRITSPAIHIERNMNKEGFKINPEENTPPIVSVSGAKFDDLMDLACENVDIKRKDVKGYSMELFDIQKGTVGGLSGDLIFSRGIDDLSMCYAGIEALLRCKSPVDTVLVSLFDNEEIGSSTLNGAGSSFLDAVIERVAGGRDEFLRCMATGIQISADGAHAVHPNYPSKHDSKNRPVINSGPVIKVNARQRYSTSDISTAYFRVCAEEAGVDLQYFVSRNDMPCGSTIGPITSTRTGMTSIDVGNPMLSMHSIREMAGTEDHKNMILVMKKCLLNTSLINPPTKRKE